MTNRGLTPRGAMLLQPMVLAFGLLNLATPVRVLAVYLAPGWYVGWILLSGLLWLLAFWAFAVVYNPKAATRFPRGLKRIMPPYWAAR